MTTPENARKKLMEFYEALLLDEEWRKKIISIINPDYVRRNELQKVLDELKKQREDFNKRFEESNKRYEELREDMNKRFEAMDKRFEAVDKRFEELIDTMNKRFEAVDKRFEEQEKRVDRRFDKVFARLDDMSASFGHDFEEFNSYWLQTFLVEQGYPKIKIQKKSFYDERYEVFPDSKEVEIDLFNEDPLVVGEVTAVVRNIDKVTTFIRKVKFIETKFGPAKYKLFITYAIRPEILDEAIKLLEEENIKVIILRRKKRT